MSESLWDQRQTLLERERREGRRDLAARRALNAKLLEAGASSKDIRRLRNVWMKASKSEAKRREMLGGSAEDFDAWVRATEPQPFAQGGFGALHRIKGVDDKVVKFLCDSRKNVEQEWILSKMTSDIGVSVGVHAGAIMRDGTLCKGRSDGSPRVIGVLVLDRMDGDLVDMTERAVREDKIAEAIEGINRDIPNHIDALVNAGYSCHDLKGENALFSWQGRVPRVYLSDWDRSMCTKRWLRTPEGHSLEWQATVDESVDSGWACDGCGRTFIMEGHRRHTGEYANEPRFSCLACSEQRDYCARCVSSGKLGLPRLTVYTIRNEKNGEIFEGQMEGRDFTPKFPEMHRSPREGDHVKMVEYDNRSGLFRIVRVNTEYSEDGSTAATAILMRLAMAIILSVGLARDFQAEARRLNKTGKRFKGDTMGILEPYIASIFQQLDRETRLRTIDDVASAMGTIVDPETNYTSMLEVAVFLGVEQYNPKFEGESDRESLANVLRAFRHLIPEGWDDED